MHSRYESSKNCPLCPASVCSCWLIYSHKTSRLSHSMSIRKQVMHARRSIKATPSLFNACGSWVLRQNRQKDFDPLTMSKTGAIDNTRQNKILSKKGTLHLGQRCKLQNLAHNLQPRGNLPCKEQQVGDVESNVSCSGYVIAFGHQRDHGTCSSPQSHNGCSSIQVRTREQLACSTSQQSINFSCHALDVLQLLIHT